MLRYDDSFHFGFRPNIFFTTLFYCSFEWPGSGRVHWFDIYTWHRDYERCSNCQWIVKESGPCFYDTATRMFDFCYQWNRVSLMK
ncbi:unnamed protein product [Linum tenue]|uniref:S-protein homolog n=1 Tax=Linum tenue TaxID=586396 RepID=A0AAV0RPK3_9ROSI|nr:unnamed protein product [Linum tenue]